MSRATVLVIDDDPGTRDMIAHDLEARSYHVLSAESAEDGLRIIDAEDVSAVITDINLGGISGVELCARVRVSKPDLPIIVMTASGSLDVAVHALRATAYDFVTKPFEFDQLALIVDRAYGLYTLRRELARLRVLAAEHPKSAATLIGRSPALDRLRELISRVAPTGSTILITGESGTGKEIVAHAIHEASERKDGPLVAINCAAMPEPLLESELFGHARGAFTDAKTARAGLFARAEGGTIFLDEIGEMPLGMQAKLLRAVQERRIRPVGSDYEIPFDARIVAATHRNLEEAVKEKRFREDLYYRINVVRIDVAPLRSRDRDVLLLAQRFIDAQAPAMRRDVKGISAAVARKLLDFPWPGNVRQLQNCIERALATSRSQELQLEDLPDDIRSHEASRVNMIDVDAGTLPTMEEIERRYISEVLRVLGGNKTLAAQVLGYDRRTLYRKLERLTPETATAAAPTTTTLMPTPTPS